MGIKDSFSPVHLVLDLNPNDTIVMFSQGMGRVCENFCTQTKNIPASENPVGELVKDLAESSSTLRRIGDVTGDTVLLAIRRVSPDQTEDSEC